MRRIFAALGVSLALAAAGCSSITNPISQTQVYQLENGYGVVQAGAAAYARLPFCPAGITMQQSVLQACSIRSAVIEIGKADEAARVALRTAEDFVRNNPKLSAVSVITTAQNAINAALQIEATYGVKS
jgi:hypothetical protein